MTFDEPSPRAEDEHGITALPSVVAVEAKDIPIVQLVTSDAIPSVSLVEGPPPGDVSLSRSRPSFKTRLFLSHLLLSPTFERQYPEQEWKRSWDSPMLFWAFLWAVAFVALNVIVSLGVIVGTIFVNCVLVAAQGGNYREYLDSLFVLPSPKTEQDTKGVIPPQKEVARGQAPESAAPTKPSPYTPALGRALMPAMIATQLALLLFGWVVLRFTAGAEWARKVGLRRPSITQAFIAVFGLPGLMIVATAVHALSKKVLPGGGYQQDLEVLFDSWPLWFGVLAVGIGPGLAEELFCRGFLGRGLLGRFGFWLGMLVVSLLFGAMHIDPPHILATAVMGFALHYSYVMTRSLWVPMFLHTVNNSTGVLMTKLSSLRDADPSPEKVPLYMYAAALLLLGAVAYALYRSRPRLVAEGDQPPWQPDYPGMEHPPEGSGTVVHRPWPGWLASGLVVLAVALFAGGVWTAMEQEKAKAPGEPKTAIVSAFLARPF